MTAIKTNKDRVLTLLVLVFLLFTRWMFYRLELDTGINTLRFVAEGVLFLLVYGLCLFRVPPMISGTCLLVGCAAMGCLYGFMPEAKAADSLLPLAYFPVFLFFIDQRGALENGESMVRGTVLSGLLYVHPALFLGLILYTALTTRFGFSLDFVYCLLLSVLICFIYSLIMRMPMKKQSKVKKERKEQDAAHMRTEFLCAIIVIPETVLYSLMNQNVTLVHTLLILWIVNLLLLYGQGHPLVRAFFERLRQKQTDFLADL